MGSLSLRLRPDHGSPWRDPHFSDCIEELLAKPVNGVNAPQRPDCVAGHVRLELRNVATKYPFERSHRFPGIQPNFGDRDRSRLSCEVGDTQLGRKCQDLSGGCCAGAWSSRRIAEMAGIAAILGRSRDDPAAAN
jgi:hypothetical protein